MQALFLMTLRMSLRASILIAAIFLLRRIFRGIPRRKMMLPYALTAFLLIVPLSFAAPADRNETTLPDSGYSFATAEKTAERVGTSADAPNIPETHAFNDESVSGQVEKSSDEVKTPAKTVGLREIIRRYVLRAAAFCRGETTVRIAAAVWLFGAVGMLLYLLLTCIILTVKLRTATRVEEQVYESPAVSSPFVYGLLRPRIYIPCWLADAAEAPVCAEIIRHEKTHLKRGDHLTKLFAWCVLSAHWFNPFVRLAYRMFTEDTEIACDEETVAMMSLPEKKDYARALVGFEAKKRGILFRPAFAETSVKERIEQMMKVKKRPGFALPVLLLTCAAALTALCACDVRMKDSEREETSASETAGTEKESVTEPEASSEHETAPEMTEEENTAEETVTEAETTASPETAQTESETESETEKAETETVVYIWEEVKENPDFEPEMVCWEELRDPEAYEWLVEYMRYVGRCGDISGEPRIGEYVQERWSDMNRLHYVTNYKGEVRLERIYYETEDTVLVRMSTFVDSQGGGLGYPYRFLLMKKKNGQWMTEKDVFSVFAEGAELEALFAEVMETIEKHVWTEEELAAAREALIERLIERANWNIGGAGTTDAVDRSIIERLVIRTETEDFEREELGFRLYEGPSVRLDDPLMLFSVHAAEGDTEAEKLESGLGHVYLVGKSQGVYKAAACAFTQYAYEMNNEGE